MAEPEPNLTELAKLSTYCIESSLNELNPDLHDKSWLIAKSDGSPMVVKESSTLLGGQLGSIGSDIFNEFAFGKDSTRDLSAESIKKFNDSNPDRLLRYIPFNNPIPMGNIEFQGMCALTNRINDDFFSGHAGIHPADLSILQIIVTDKVSSYLLDPGNIIATLGTRDAIETGISIHIWGMAKRLGLDLGSNLSSVATKLSLSTYEKSPIDCTIIIGSKQSADILELRDHIAWSDSKGLSKASQATLSNQVLLADKDGIYGLSNRDSAPDGLVIEIAGNGTWRPGIINGGTMLMPGFEYRGGLPKVPHKHLSIEPEIEIFEGLNTDSVPVDWETVKSIANSIGKLGHGSIFIFSSEAATEVNRLQRQCHRVTPQPYNPDIHSGISSVDGAVILDMNGTVHAYGAILDGIGAPDVGDRSRGSRYNSVRKYIHIRHGLAFGILASDDGDIDVIVR